MNYRDCLHPFVMENDVTEGAGLNTEFMKSSRFARLTVRLNLDFRSIDYMRADSAIGFFKKILKV